MKFELVHSNNLAAYLLLCSLNFCPFVHQYKMKKQKQMDNKNNEQNMDKSELFSGTWAQNSGTFIEKRFQYGKFQIYLIDQKRDPYETKCVMYLKNLMGAETKKDHICKINYNLSDFKKTNQNELLNILILTNINNRVRGKYKKGDFTGTFDVILGEFESMCRIF